MPFCSLQLVSFSQQLYLRDLAKLVRKVYSFLSLLAPYFFLIRWAPSQSWMLSRVKEGVGEFLIGRSVDEQRPGGQFGIPIKIQSVSAVRHPSAVSGSGGETPTRVWARRGTPLTRTPAHTRLEEERFRGNHRDRGSPSRLFWWDAGASHQVILTPRALTRGFLAGRQGPRGSPSPVIIPRPGAAAVPGAVRVQGTLQGSSS